MIATSQKQVKAFDFTQAKRLSRDHIAGFDFVAQNMGKMLTAYFTTLFRRLVEVRAGKVAEIAYFDFMESRENPTCLWTFETSATPHVALMEIQPSFTFLIVDRLFSGHGVKMKGNRPITSIEQSILTRVIERFLQIWDQAWRPIYTMTTQNVGFETQSYLVQIAGRNDSTIQLAFDVMFEGEHHTIDICLPFPFLEPLMVKMKDQSWSNVIEKQSKNESRGIILPTVLKTKNNLKVSLGNTKISIKEYFNLQEGNVLVLDQKVGNPLVASVADKPCLWVKPGIKDNTKVVKVIKRFKEAEEEWTLEN